MDDYIERDALLADISAAVKHRGMGEIIGQTLMRYVKRQPAADVAPVVRCKDCKHAESYLRLDGKTGVYCRCPVSIFDYANGYVFTPSRNVDDFCSYGKYQTNGGADHEA